MPKIEKKFFVVSLLPLELQTDGRKIIIHVFVCFAGMKVNGGSSQRDWLFVNFSNPDSLIGTLRISRSKIDPCTVTSSICSGSRDDFYCSP